MKGEDGSGQLRDHRRPRRGDQAGRPAGLVRPGGRVRRARRSWSRRWTSPPSWPWPPAWTRCARPASRWCRPTGRTTTGKYLPDRWMLPESLRDETGVIFASAFPGGDRLADEFERYYTCARTGWTQLAALEDLRASTRATPTTLARDRPARCATLRDELDREPYSFDRRFLFRILSMGHTQFAEYIGARGPNTAGQRGLRQHHPGDRPGRGLDPHRPLPARARHRRRRRDQRQPAGMGRGRASWRPAPPPPTTGSPRRPCPSTAAATARSWAWAPAPWWSRAKTPCASAACAASSRCWPARPPTAPSTAPAWTSTTSPR